MMNYSRRFLRRGCVARNPLAVTPIVALTISLALFAPGSVNAAGYNPCTGTGSGWLLEPIVENAIYGSLVALGVPAEDACAMADDLSFLEDRCSTCGAEVANPVNMLTGTKVESAVDIAVEGLEGTPIVLSRVYAPEAKAYWKGYAESGLYSSAGYPWMTSADERIVFDVRTPLYYGTYNYRFPIQITRLLPDGSREAYYAETDTPTMSVPYPEGATKVHEIDGFPRFKYSGRKEVVYSYSYGQGCSPHWATTSIKYFDVDGVQIGTTEVHTNLASQGFYIPPDLEYASPATLYEMADSADANPGFIHYFSTAPNSSSVANGVTTGEPVGQHFRLPVAYSAWRNREESIDPVQATCLDANQQWHSSTPPAGHKILYFAELEVDGNDEEIELKLANGSGSVFYDSPDIDAAPLHADEGRPLRAASRYGVTTEFFPAGQTVSILSNTWQIAQRSRRGAEPWDTRMLLYRFEDLGGADSIHHWAVSWGGSAGTPGSALEMAAWVVDDGMLARVDYPDADWSVHYDYGSYTVSGGGQLVEDPNGGEAPGVASGNGVTYTPAPSRSLAKISSGPIGGAALASVAYTNTKEVAVAGPSRFTFLPGHPLAVLKPTDNGDWVELYQFDFNPGSPTERANALILDWSTYETETAVRWAGLHEDKWVRYRRSDDLLALDEILYPGGFNTRMDYLGRPGHYDGNDYVRSSDELNRSFYREHQNTTVPAVRRRDRIKKFGFADESPLLDFDLLAESSLEFLVEGPKSTQGSWDGYRPRYPNHSLDSSVSYTIRSETGLRQVNSVKDRYGNKVEYLYDYDASDPTLLDGIAASYYIAQLNETTGEIEYASEPTAFRSVEYLVTANGYRVPSLSISAMGARATSTLYYYGDADYETSPTRVTVSIDEPPASEEVVKDVQIDYDDHGRVLRVIDLLSTADVEYAYLRPDCPFATAVKSIVSTDPASREDEVERFFYNETDPTNMADPTGPKYSFLAPSIKSVVYNDGEPDESATSYEYDARGRMTALQDDHNQRIAYAYHNATSRIESVSAILPGAGSPSEIKYTYDLFGATTSLMDEEGHSWQYYYDVFQRLAAVKNPAGEVTAYIHDPNQRNENANPLNKPFNPDPYHQYFPNEVGWPLTIYGGGDCGCSSPAGTRVYRTIRFSADAPWSQTTGSGSGQTFGNKANIDAKIVEVQDFYYDSGGNVGYVEVFASGTGEPLVPNVEQFKKRTIKIERDQIGRVVAIHDSGTNSPFDAGGEDIDAGTTRFEYYEDPLLPNYLKLKKKTEPDGFEQEFAYDDWGRATRATNQLGLASSVSFENAHPFRTELTRSHLGGTTTLHRSDGSVAGAGRWGTVNKISRKFNSGGAADLDTIPDTLDTIMTFDSQDRLASLAHVWAADAPVELWKAEHSSHDTATHNRLNETTYFPVNTLTQSPEENKAVASYGYNARGALTSWTVNGVDQASPLTRSETFVVDKAHNVATKGSFANTYNAFNQLLTSVSGGSTSTFDWDSRGNLKSRDDSATGTGADAIYYYDEFNRLQMVAQPGAANPTVGYTRNAGGQLVRRRTWNGSGALTSDRRTFFSGVWPSLTLLGSRPEHAHVDEFSNSAAFSEWEVYDDFPNHTATWSHNTTSSGVARANATGGGSEEGTLLWPEGFEQGSGGFTLETRMNLGVPPGTGGKALQGAISGGGGVILNLRTVTEPAEISQYYRVYTYWSDARGNNNIDLRVALERETWAEAETTSTVELIQTSGYIDPGALGSSNVQLRVQYALADPNAAPDPLPARLIVSVQPLNQGWTNAFTHVLDGTPFSPENQVGLYAVGQTVDFLEASIDRDDPWSGAAPKELGHAAADWTPVNATVTAGSDATAGAVVTSWIEVDDTAAGSHARWDGAGASLLGHSDAGRPAIGLLLRRESGGTATNMRVEVDLDTSAGLRTMSYDHTASSPSVAGTKATIPWKGDVEAAHGAWHLAAFDPTEDLRHSFTTLTSTGRIRAVRVYGTHFSIGGFWAWERLPEVIYNGGVEWRLHRRWQSESTPASSAAHYEIKTRAVLKNTSGDAVLFAGQNPTLQASDYQFFDAYGQLVAKGSGLPQDGVAMAQGPPAAGRAGVFRLGMTSKPWDPDAKLYHFGFRERGDGSNGFVGWLQADPAGMVDGPNVFQFVLGDPVNGVDLDGLSLFGWAEDAWEWTINTACDAWNSPLTQGALHVVAGIATIAAVGLVPATLPFVVPALFAAAIATSQLAQGFALIATGDEELADIARIPNPSELTDHWIGPYLDYAWDAYNLVVTGCAAFQVARAGVHVLKKLQAWRKARRSQPEIPVIPLEVPSFDVPRVDWDRQGKHVRGHKNFDPKRSELTADPEAMAQKAGTGIPSGGKRGDPHFREHVYFQRPIGKTAFETGGEHRETNWATFIYSNGGKDVHIYPSRPPAPPQVPPDVPQVGTE